MLTENITFVFQNKTSFIKLEINSECSYYLAARKKNQDFISNVIKWNLTDKSIITHKKFTTCSTTCATCLVQTWSAFNMFLALCVWSLRKGELWLSKFMYRIDTMLSLIFLVSAMLKIPRTNVETHFLKKLTFVNSKLLV